MTPLEKAAKAYALAEGYPDDFKDDVDGEYRAWCFEVARAVLMAVREPDEETCLSACKTEGVANRWQAMIDAILAEPQP
jgi:hypothetical protein